MLLRGDSCYCADRYPKRRDLIPNEHCSLPCPNNPSWACGGSKAYGAYHLGLELDTEREYHVDRRPKSIDQPAHPLEMVPQGCSKILPNSAARVYPKGYARDMIVEGCIWTCHREGNALAMMLETTCWCATTFPLATGLVEDDQCHIPCPGTPGRTCGGRGYAYTVYSTGLWPEVKQDGQRKKKPLKIAILRKAPGKNAAPYPLPFMEPTAENWTSHGCYNMPPNIRNHRLERYGKFGNSGASCSDYCKRVERKAVAVTREGECSCSDRYPKKSAWVDDANCDIPCPNFPHEACGGHEVWSIFNTGLHVIVSSDEEQEEERYAQTEKPKLPFYGCFDDRPSGSKAVDLYRRYRTQGDSCNYACASEGYPVALRHSGECWCARSYPETSSRVDDAKCWFACLDDALEMCGGPGVYSVYRTRLDWAVDDEEDDPSTSAVTRPWKCPRRAVQRAKDVAAWIMDKVTWIADMGCLVFGWFSVSIWHVCEALHNGVNDHFGGGRDFEI